MSAPSTAATLLAGLAYGGFLAAAGGTATDQAVSLTYSVTHWSEDPAADLVGVDGTGDPLFQSGFWYRVSGDTREYPLPPPDSEVYANGQILAFWTNLGGKGFEVMEFTVVEDREGPSGGFWTRLLVTNHNPVVTDFTLFHYLDVDLAASAAGDLGAMVAPGFLEFADTGSWLSYRAPRSSLYQVAAYPALRALLNDSSVTTLSHSGLPFGPGDVTAAFQFGPVGMGPAEIFDLGWVSAWFNPARRRVKGDRFGLGQAALCGQQYGLAQRGVEIMRRSSQVVGPFLEAAPTPSSSLVGTDDFYGSYTDDHVYRDGTTGAVYLNLTPVSGAPTLPLNWKLSATGDFNADGLADILWRNTTSQKLVIWTMNGATKVGNIIPSPDQAVDANWEVAAAADFNRDGHRDLLWYNQTSGKIVLWFMNASVVRISGQFTNPATVGNNNWRVLAVGDFGKGPGGVYDTQDLVWQNDTSKRVVVWFMDLAGNRTSGTFTTPDLLNGGWDLVGPR